MATTELGKIDDKKKKKKYNVKIKTEKMYPFHYLEEKTYMAVDPGSDNPQPVTSTIVADRIYLDERAELPNHYFDAFFHNFPQNLLQPIKKYELSIDAARFTIKVYENQVRMESNFPRPYSKIYGPDDIFSIYPDAMVIIQHFVPFFQGVSEIKKKKELEFHKIVDFIKDHFQPQKRYAEEYPFINDKIKLKAVIEKGKQRLEFWRLEGAWKLLDTKSCIHTAVMDIPLEQFEERISDENFEKDVLNIRSTEKLKEIHLEIEEKWFAFKSWVQGIAEAGYGAFYLQGEIESYGHLVDSITTFLIRNLAKVSEDYLVGYLNYLEKTCKFEGSMHLPSLYANFKLLHKAIGDKMVKHAYPIFGDAFRTWYFNEIWRGRHVNSERFEENWESVVKGDIFQWDVRSYGLDNLVATMNLTALGNRMNSVNHIRDASGNLWEVRVTPYEQDLTEGILSGRPLATVEESQHQSDLLIKWLRFPEEIREAVITRYYLPHDSLVTLGIVRQFLRQLATEPQYLVNQNT